MTQTFRTDILLHFPVPSRYIALSSLGILIIVTVQELIRKLSYSSQYLRLFALHLKPTVPLHIALLPSRHHFLPTMTRLVPYEDFVSQIVDFDAVVEGIALPNVAGSESLPTLSNSGNHNSANQTQIPDQYPQANNAMSAQPIQYASQSSTILSPTQATTHHDTSIPQQWATPPPTSQYGANDNAYVWEEANDPSDWRLPDPLPGQYPADYFSPIRQQQHAPPVPPKITSSRLRPRSDLNGPNPFPQRRPLPIRYPTEPPLLPPHLQQPKQNQPYNPIVEPYPAAFPFTTTPLASPYLQPPIQNQPYNPSVDPYQAAFPFPAPAMDQLQYQQQQTSIFAQQQLGPIATPNQAAPLLPTPPTDPSPTKILTKPPSAKKKKNQPTPKPKDSNPAGVPKKRGRKPKDFGKTGFINTTLAPEEHHNIAIYGRNSLRGEAGKERLAQSWNQPSVKGKGTSSQSQPPGPKL